MPTLADVLDRLSSIDNTALRLELQRDVRRFASIVRQDGEPGRIDVQPQIIAGLLGGILPSDLGRCTAKRLANFRSNIRKALRIACPELAIKRRCTASTEAAWHAVWEQIPIGHKWAKIRAHSVVNYCLALDIGPAAVPSDCFADFRAWFVKTSLSAKAATAAREAVVAYNGLVANGLLPGAAIIPPTKPTLTLPLSAFPASFQADVRAYLTYMADPHATTAPKGARKPKSGRYRRSTILFRERIIRCGAALLVDAGVPAVDIKTLADLVAHEHFALMMRRYHEREASRLAADAASGKRNEWGDEKTSSAHTVAKTIRSIICGWYSPNPEAINYLNRVVASTRRSVTTVNGREVERVMRKRGLTAKVRKRLDAIDDQTLRRLLDLPVTFARDIRRERTERGTITVPMACRFQIAVAIGLMWLTPVRLENLRTIDVERHLDRSVARRKGAVMNLVSVKNDNPITVELTAEYLALLDEYLADYRPVLNPTSDALFPGRSADGFLHSTSLSRRISRDVSGALGCRFNPHLFRHLIAMRIVRGDPSRISLAATVLHNSVETCRRCYTDDQSHLAASIVEQHVIRDLRRGGRRL